MMNDILESKQWRELRKLIEVYKTDGVPLITMYRIKWLVVTLNAWGILPNTLLVELELLR
jgi:hypothetical protein